MFRWFVQSILSDVQNAQCQGTPSLLLSAPLLSLDLPVHDLFLAVLTMGKDFILGVWECL